VYSKKGRTFKTESRRYFGIVFCMSGQITYTMNGKTYVSNQGNAIFLPHGSSYSLVGDSEGQFPVINFLGKGLDCKEITVLPLEDPQAHLQRFKTLQRLFLRNESQMKIYSTFYDLLDQLMSPSDQNTDQLAFAMKYIEAHIQDPTLSNVEIAKCLGISEVYLRKQFQTHYRVTPKQYILDVRIRKAKHLLVDAPFTVTAIAEECGFSSVYHFCRSFRQRTGKTPTQYAAENRSYQI
jgi:AraC-like DNA-binding protein